MSTISLHGAAHLELTPHQQMRTSSQHSSWWLVYLQLVCNLPVWRATRLLYMLCQVWVVFFLTCHTKVEWFYGCDNFYCSVSVSVYDESELTMLEELHGLIWSHMLVVVMAFGHLILVWQLWQYTDRSKQCRKMAHLPACFYRLPWCGNLKPILR